MFRLSRQRTCRIAVDKPFCFIARAYNSTKHTVYRLVSTGSAACSGRTYHACCVAATVDLSGIFGSLCITIILVNVLEVLVFLDIEISIISGASSLAPRLQGPVS